MVLEGTPEVETFEVTNSTLQKITEVINLEENYALDDLRYSCCSVVVGRNR
jgi:hypothetical protein